MTLTDQFDSSIASGNLQELLQFYREHGAAYDEKLSLVASSWYLKAIKRDFKNPPLPNQSVWPFTYYCVLTSAHALLVSGDEKSILKLPLINLPEEELNFEIIALAPRANLNAWLTKLIDEGRNYSLVHRLTAGNFCDVPDSDNYVLFFIGHSGYLSWKSSASLFERLSEDPIFLEKTVWRFFQVEGDGPASLAAQDKYSQGLWRRVLVQLSDQGHLSRSRLLDESLNALSRGFSQFRASWFSAFHEELKPSLDERLERLDAYGNLLSCGAPSITSFALDVLLQVNKARPLNIEFCRNYLPAALRSPWKTCVLSALKILNECGKHDSTSHSRICEIITDALLLESADVQRQVAAMLKRFGKPDDKALRESVSEKVSLIAPSVQKELTEFIEPTLNHSGGPAPDDGPRFAPYAFLKKEPPNPLTFNSKIDPIDDWDELLSALTRALEHPEDLDLIERCLDGISRLCSSRPEDLEFKSAALKKRALKLYETSKQTAQILFAGFVYSWLTSSADFEGGIKLGHLNYTFIQERIKRILKRASQRRAFPLLSAPTHRSGWIDPLELKKRFDQCEVLGFEPELSDQVVALLRLPLSNLHDFREVNDLPGSFWEAARYAARITEECQLDPNHLLHIAATAAREQINPSSLDLRATDHSELLTMRWLAHMYPAARNLFFRGARRLLTWSLDPLPFDRHVLAAYFELLLQPNSWYCTEAISAIAIGLISANAMCSGYAKDALIQSVADDAMDIDYLGDCINMFLYSELSKPLRLAKSLNEVANISNKHADAVAQLLELALRGGTVAPRDLSPVLELFYELLIKTGRDLSDSATIAHLTSLKVGGKSGALIKKLVQHG